ncbi:MAG: putative 2-dehydropantoate 2-reductase [Bacteroidales bacterium]|nr:putative 2-dehydropantoate 2-reductase [Bacteroidales bacterium]
MFLTYAIVGTGGIGGYYGGCLAKAGHPVHFLLHSDYEYVLKNGLKIDSVNGDFHLEKVSAYKNSQDMPKCDVVLVCLKTIENHILSSILKPLLHEKTVVVLVQNGMGMEQELSEQLPSTSIVGATAFICTTKVGPGHIHHAEYGALTLAKHCGDCDEIIRQIASDFENASVNVSVFDDLNSVRWKKLVWNIPYNGLTVVLNAATDTLTNNPDSRNLVIDLMNEVVSAGRTCGAKISDSFIDKMIAMTENMTPYSPSMKLDYDARRPMEIQTMFTNPIAIAKAQGFEMRKTEMLEQQLRFLEKVAKSI